MLLTKMFGGNGNGHNGTAAHKSSTKRESVTLETENLLPTLGGAPYVRTAITGQALMTHPQFNKGLAFTAEERKALNLRGLLPDAVETITQQVERELALLRRKGEPIQKYIHLIGLLERNETLFYRVVMENISECMPIVYTPTVGQACIEYSELFQQGRGMYITKNDKGKILSILNNWPQPEVKVIVVTDGERILGLGDLGANGMGIPIGKLMLYSAIGGIDPKHCLPVTLDVGTENKALREDKFYIGVREARLRGEAYNSLVLEFFEACKRRFGKNVLIQFEDFGNSTAFHLLEMTRNKFCTFNDDIQGTAAVSLAGVISSLRITSKYNGPKRLSEHVYVFHGAGEAGTGIAELIAQAIDEEGQTLDGARPGLAKARENIWLVDSKGLVCGSRKDELAHHKVPFSHPWKVQGVPAPKTLEEVVRILKPTCLVGVSASPNQFTKEICEQMCKNTPRPVIFALSNPTSKAECTAEDCYKWTKGLALFASGSPFDPVVLKRAELDTSLHAELLGSKGDSVTLYPGQGNNAYIFPALGLGVLGSGSYIIPDELILTTSHGLAEQVTEDDLKQGALYPPLNKIREVATNIGARVAECAYLMGIATNLPRPRNLVEYCISLQYQPDYLAYESKL